MPCLHFLTFVQSDIGMPLHEAFAQVDHQPNIYDVVHVKYFDEVSTLLPFFHS